MHLTFILLLIYNMFKVINDKVKLERSRMWQLDNSCKRKACERLMVDLATPSKLCFPLIYIFFEVMLVSRIDVIRSCLEDCILLFLFNVGR